MSFMGQYSSTACARLLFLTNKPSFASMSTKNNVAIGSTILPTYNPSGGPNGKGHVNFDRSIPQYLNGGSRTLNIGTNGGFSVVIIMRFNSLGPEFEALIGWGTSSNPYNNPSFGVYRHTRMLLVEINTNNGNYVHNSDNNYEIVGNEWITMSFRFSVSTLSWKYDVNGVQSVQSGAIPPLLNFYDTFIGRSSDNDYPSYTSGDYAGVFVVDEYLSTGAMTAIADAMKQGVDMTTVCDSGVGACNACVAGKYKNVTGPSACTDCVASKYSSAIAATSINTCTQCFPNSGSTLVGSSSINVCQCTLGYEYSAI